MANSSDRRRRIVYAGVGAGAVLAAMLSVSANAAPAVVSSLVATPSSVTIDLASVPPSAPVSVRLDPATCINPLVNGLTYGVALKTGYDASVVGVSGSGDGPYQCNSGAANFTLTGLSCGNTTVGFHPVVSNNGGHDPNGVQNRVGGGSVSVTVVNSADTTSNPLCSAPVVTPPLTGNPAAPAVANTYIGASGTTYAKTCKAHVGSNNWRGVVISQIAAWMPRPESLKDDPADFPLADGRSWTDYVTAQVDYYCGYSSSQVLPAPTSLPGAHT